VAANRNETTKRSTSLGRRFHGQQRQGDETPGRPRILHQRMVVRHHPAAGVPVDPRTVVLISLANAAGLLSENFGRKEIRSRKKRVEQIVNGEVTGTATKEVIAACEAATMVAVMMPMMMMSSTHN
jgi:hypothetical protein